MQEYSNPKRAADPYALPDIEVFYQTAFEVAANALDHDDDLMGEYQKRFPLFAFNSRERDRMIDAVMREEGIKGGFYYWSCFPGCLPDSDAVGPFATYNEALKEAQEDYADWDKGNEDA